MGGVAIAAAGVAATAGGIEPEDALLLLAAAAVLGFRAAIGAVVRLESAVEATVTMTGWMLFVLGSAVGLDLAPWELSTGWRVVALATSAQALVLVLGHWRPLVKPPGRDSWDSWTGHALVALASATTLVSRAPLPLESCLAYAVGFSLLLHHARGAYARPRGGVPAWNVRGVASYVLALGALALQTAASAPSASSAPFAGLLGRLALVTAAAAGVAWLALVGDDLDRDPALRRGARTTRPAGTGIRLVAREARERDARPASVPEAAASPPVAPSEAVETRPARDAPPLDEAVAAALGGEAAPAGAPAATAAAAPAATAVPVEEPAPAARALETPALTVTLDESAGTVTTMAANERTSETTELRTERRAAAEPAGSAEGDARPDDADPRRARARGGRRRRLARRGARGGASRH